MRKGNGVFLYRDDGKRVLGVQNPDGSENEFLPVYRMHTRARIIGSDGDSITAYGSAGSDGTGAYASYPLGLSNRSYLSWASILLGGVMEFGPNTGIAGETTDQLINRFYTAGPGIWGDNVDIISVNIGHNDFKTASTNEYIKQNILRIWKMCLEFGKPVMVYTINMPSSSTSAYGRRFDIVAVNQWIRTESAKYKSLHLCDTAAAITDPTNANGEPYSTATSDGLHPNGYGAYLMGAEVARSVPYLFPLTYPYIKSIADTYGATTKSNQLIDTPLFLGSSGAVSGAGVSGTVATGWTASLASGTATVVCSVSAADTGYGNKQILTITASTNSVITLTCASIHSRINTGDTIYTGAYVDVGASAGITRLDWSISQTIAGVTKRYSSLQNDTTGMPTSAYKGFFKTPEQIIPSGSVTDFRPGIVISISAGATLVVSFSNAECRRK